MHCGVAVPADGQDDGGSHGVHELLPEAANVPAAQGIGWTIPFEAAHCEPAGHIIQASDDEEPGCKVYLPKGHGRP